MEQSCDIAIIGCGIAAMGAIHRLQESSAGDICVVGEHTGASIFSNGAWDPQLLAPGQLPSGQPSVLTQIGPGSTSSTNMSQRGERWNTLVCRSLDELLVSQPQEMWLADGWGRIFSATTAQFVHLAGDLRPILEASGTERGKIGLLQLGDASISPYPAREYNRKYTPHEERFIDIEATLPLRSSSPFALARQLHSDEAICTSLLNSIKHQTADCAVLLCPPIFGLDRPQELLERFRDALHCPVAELLSTHPSPAGLRLHHRLIGWYEKLPYPRIEGLVEHADVHMGTVERLGIRLHGEEQLHYLRPRVILLCTGNAAGGGIVINPKVPAPVEKIFHLPAGDTPGENPLENIWKLGHGIQVDQNSQPCDSYGGAHLTNLFAAGHVVSRWPAAKTNPSVARQRELSLELDHTIPVGTMAQAFQQGYLAADCAIQAITPDSRSKELVS